MSRQKDTNRPSPGADTERNGRKTYQKPAVRYERIFETSALMCGKVQTTQQQCHLNPKAS
jgi:hypothetical protein